jgi:glycosyltransferase involved in cell wall biosynthesis
MKSGKIKILSFLRFYTDVSGGIQNLAWDLQQGLSSEFEFVNFIRKDGTSIADSFQDGEILNEIVCFPKTFKVFGSRRFWKSSYYLVKCLIQIINSKCDIIHVHWLEDAFIISFLKLFHRKPIVYTCHGPMAAKNFIGRYKYIKTWRKAFNKIDIIVPVSTAVEMKLISEIGNKIKIKKILNGVKIPSCLTSKPLNTIVMVYTGRLIRNKQIHIIIQALGLIEKDKLKSLKLILVGDCDTNYVSSLMEIIEKKHLQENVEFRGHSNTQLIFKDEANVYISASLLEGLPLSPLEAMSYGVFPVLSSIEGHKEILDDEFGLLFDPNNAIGLAKILSDLQVSDLKNKTERIHNHVKKNFSVERMQREYKGLYNSILCAE